MPLYARVDADFLGEEDGYLAALERDVVDVQIKTCFQELHNERLPTGVIWRLGWRFLIGVSLMALAGDEIEPFDKSFGQTVAGELGFGHDDETAAAF